jgi:hypothetical protein
MRNPVRAQVRRSRRGAAEWGDKTASGDLNLPAGGSLPILGDHLIEDLQLNAAQQRFVLFGVTPPLFHQTADPGVPFEIGRSHPAELVPDLQIAKVVDREPAGRRALVGVGRE